MTTPLRIEQVYCTHCTHGSSAIERGDPKGPLGHRTLGYSARAGSLRGNDLRRYFRQIEPFVYYHLPRDTPAQKKLEFTPHTAPQRLFFIPSSGGVQVLGQVFYRRTDSEGRPGSYFAHVLFQDERQDPRWTAADALRLWDAPKWQKEDAASIPFDIPPLGRLADLGDGAPAPIDDRLARAFLTEPAGSEAFRDGGVIPDRWKAMPPQARQAWLRLVLDSLWGVAPARRESVALVLEPSMAALLFYTAARLLPDHVRRMLSVSTFEAQADRMTATLSATWFHEEATGSRPDALKVRGIGLNTLLDPPDPTDHSGGYAPLMLDTLVEHGWEKVDAKLKLFETSGAVKYDQLKSLAAVDRAIGQLLQGTAAPPELWKAQIEHRYARAVVVETLAGAEDHQRPPLLPIVGSEAHFSVLELLAPEPSPPETAKALQQLLMRLPEDKVALMLDSPRIPEPRRHEALWLAVRRLQRMPPGCERLWTKREGELPKGACRYPLSAVFARLEDKTLFELFENSRQDRLGEFLNAALESHNSFKPRTDLFNALGKALTEQEMLALPEACGPAFLTDYPREAIEFRDRLMEMLERLFLGPPDIGKQLDLLDRCEKLLPREDYKNALAEWKKAREAIATIVDLQQKVPLSKGNRKELTTQCRELAKAAYQLQYLGFLPSFPAGAPAARHAPPDPAPMADSHGHARPPGPPDHKFEDTKTSLRAVALALTGEQLLPDGVSPFPEMWPRIRTFVQGGSWDGRKGTSSRKKGWTGYLTHPATIGGMVVAPLLGVALWFAWRTFYPAPPPAPEEPPRLAIAQPEQPAERPKPETKTETKTKGEIQPPGERSKTEEPAKTSPEGEPQPLPPAPQPESKTSSPQKTGEGEPPPKSKPKPEAKPKSEPKDPDDLPPPKEDDFPKWSENASRYAAENKALYYPRREMQAGVWILPVADFGGKPLDGQKYWVGGRLELGDYSEAFRGEATSGLSIELPKLADAKRLKRARLTVSPKEADGVQFSFYFEFFETPAEAAKELDGKIKDAEAKLGKLSALLKKHPGSDRAFRDELRNILGPDHEALQGLPPPPEKSAFPDDKTFKEAEQNWNDRRDEWLKKLPLKATEAQVAFNKTILPQLRKQKTDKMKAAAERNENRETELKSKPWRLSVVFGIEGEELRPKAAANPVAKAAVVSEAGSPMHEDPTAPRTEVLAAGGSMKWDQKPLSDKNKKLLIVQQFAVHKNGKRTALPQGIVCDIELLPQGQKQPIAKLQSPTDKKELDGPQWVQCRVNFYFQDQQGTTLRHIQFLSSAVKELFAGMSYDVKFEISEKGYSQLEALSKGG